MGHTKFRGDAAIMNGKFESNSNDYDESNLNRLHSVPARELWRGTQWRVMNFEWMQASVARASAATPGLCLREDPAYRMRSCGLQFPPLFDSVQQHLFAVGHALTPSPLRRR